MTANGRRDIRLSLDTGPHRARAASTAAVSSWEMVDLAGVKRVIPKEWASFGP